MLHKWMPIIIVGIYGAALAIISLTWQQTGSEVSLVALKISGCVLWIAAMRLALRRRK